MGFCSRAQQGDGVVAQEILEVPGNPSLIRVNVDYSRRPVWPAPQLVKGTGDAPGSRWQDVLLCKIRRIVYGSEYIELYFLNPAGSILLKLNLNYVKANYVVLGSQCGSWL